jgi:hypothetical protein
MQAQRPQAATLVGLLLLLACAVQVGSAGGSGRDVPSGGVGTTSAGGPVNTTTTSIALTTTVAPTGAAAAAAPPDPAPVRIMAVLGAATMVLTAFLTTPASVVRHAQAAAIALKAPRGPEYSPPAARRVEPWFCNSSSSSSSSSMSLPSTREAVKTASNVVLLVIPWADLDEPTSPLVAQLGFVAGALALLVACRWIKAFYSVAQAATVTTPQLSLTPALMTRVDNAVDPPSAAGEDAYSVIMAPSRLAYAASVATIVPSASGRPPSVASRAAGNVIHLSAPSDIDGVLAPPPSLAPLASAWTHETYEAQMVIQPPLWHCAATVLSSPDLRSRVWRKVNPWAHVARVFFVFELGLLSTAAETVFAYDPRRDGGMAVFLLAIVLLAALGFGLPAARCLWLRHWNTLRWAPATLVFADQSLWMRRLVRPTGLWAARNDPARPYEYDEEATAAFMATWAPWLGFRGGCYDRLPGPGSLRECTTVTPTVCLALLPALDAARNVALCALVYLADAVSITAANARYDEATLSASLRCVPPPDIAADERRPVVAFIVAAVLLLHGAAVALVRPHNTNLVNTSCVLLEAVAAAALCVEGVGVDGAGTLAAVMFLVVACPLACYDVLTPSMTELWLKQESNLHRAAARVAIRDDDAQADGHEMNLTGTSASMSVALLTLAHVAQHDAVAGNIGRRANPLPRGETRA